MSTITYGMKVVFGIPKQQKQICPMPPGKKRLRFRVGKLAHLFVTDGITTQAYWLEDRPFAWVPHLEAVNQKVR